uniref:chitinase n=1 Tax=Coralloluteibacterium stylophorae TaxID=1776034 RepID=A0A8J7VWK0_9GAMM
MHVKHARSWLSCCLLAALCSGHAAAQEASCDAVPQWTASTIYQPGDRLTYRNRLYQAAIPIWNSPPDHCPSCGWYEDLGACGTGTGNVAPGIALTAPAPGAQFEAGASVALAANASDVDGSVVRVEFFVDGSSVGIDDSVPFSMHWTAVAGTHAIGARATDDDGATADAATRTIEVAADGGGDTTPPSVPQGLAVVASTAGSISLAWQAASDAGGVAGYDLLRDGQVVAQPTATQYTDTGLAAETSYAYAVRARDSAGNASAASPTLQARTASPDSGGDGKRVIGYYTQWGIYGRDYQVKDIDTSGAAAYLTHINYAFGNVRNNRCEVGVTQPSDPNTGAGGDAFADYGKAFQAAESVDGVADTWDQPLRGNWNQLKELKARHPGLKVLISLGGWTWSRGFSEAAKPANREAFVASCIDAYIHGDLPVTDGAGGPGAAAGVFDGIDIDWEYPAACGLSCGTPEDRENFTALLAEFRRQLDAVRPGLLLTVAVGAGIDKIEVTDPAQYAPYLDYINVMTYDVHGAWDPVTNHHSALFAAEGDPSTGVQATYNSDAAIRAFLDRGVPASKLNLGIGFYGRGWTNVGGANNGLYQSGSAAPGTYESGIEDYKVLAQLGWSGFTDADAGAHWIYNGTTFWSYDDPALILDKMAYVEAMGLGGAFFWEFSGDDADATLVKTIGQGLD